MVEFVGTLLLNLLNLLTLALFVYLIGGMLMQFGVINGRNPVIAQIYRFLDNLFQPMLAPIRRLIPDLGIMLDLSPLVLVIALQLLQGVIVEIVMI